MPRKQKTIHYLYKTTCLINKKYYYGIHSTTNIDDGYMGSGKRLRYCIRKYGVENHEKEILEFFKSRDLLVEAEKNLITSDLIQDVNCLNLKEGGTGGFTKEQQILNNKKSQDSQKKLRKNNDWKNKKSKNLTKSLKIQYKNGVRIKKYFYDWNGKKHNEITKLKISEKSSLNQKGENNSQYGTCWITNGFENKKIKKGCLIPNGWKLGRKIKK